MLCPTYPGCTVGLFCLETDGTKTPRFVDSEKWRTEFGGCGIEELVRTFDYKEKPEVFKYYPQYYHKTDKVR